MKGMQITPKRAIKIITACCVLFNVAKDLGEPPVLDRDMHDVEAEVEDLRNRDRDAAALAVRGEIVRTFAQ